MPYRIFTFEMILKWIYQRFIFIFLICFLGAICGDIMYRKEETIKSINLKKVMSITVIFSMILSTVMDYVQNISISFYILICFFTGIWSGKLISYIMNWKFVRNFLKHILKSLGNVVSKSLSESMDEIDNEENVIENEKLLEYKEKEENEDKDNDNKGTGT